MPQTMEAVFHQGDQQPRYDYTPATAKECGEIVDLGGKIGVVTTAEGIAANRMGSVATGGIFRCKKAAGAGVTFSRGDVAEWDDTNDTSVRETLGDWKNGVVAEDAADGDNGVYVEINEAPLN